MATVYIITNTEGVDTFAIQPGTLNGPGGVQTNTDLRLYGMGSMLWGEGVNENFVRLTENFSTPEKGGSPGTPQDETDLGPGNGVNTPLAGQLWFNTSTETLMVYDGAVWKSSGGTAYSVSPPPSPQDGDLWYDTAIDQLMVYDGGWASVADRYLLLDGSVPMAGDIDFQNAYHAINMVDPTNPQDAATMQYVDDEIDTIVTGGALDSLYVSKTGDTMTNQLSFPTLFLNEGNGSVALAPDIRMTSQGLIASDGIFHIHIDGDNDSDGNFIVSKGSYAVDGSEVQLFQIYNSGMLREMTAAATYTAALSDDRDIPNKKYVDDEILALSGGGSGNLAVINPATPKDGDIRVTTPGVIEMRQDSVWNQIYPAVYS